MSDQFHGQQQQHHIYNIPQCYSPQYIQSHPSQQNNNDTIQLRTLQEQINGLHHQRESLQKELTSEKQKVIQLQQQLQTQQQLSLQMQQQYDAQLRALQFELSKYKTVPPHDAFLQVQSHQSLMQLTPNKSGKMNGESVCDHCPFRTKSEVSLLLHKVNHSLTQKQLQLPTTIFTTKNNKSSFLYKCPVCDGKYTRHEIYSHIYQYHTTEQPHHCTECDLFFTHYDYLTEHQRDKHSKGRKRSPPVYSNMKNYPKKNRFTPLVSSPASSSAWNSLETIISNTIGTLDENNCTVSLMDSRTETSLNHQNKSPNSFAPKSAINATDKSEGEFKCTYSDCGFATNTKERLEFHISAHKNSKFKCPYCPYVGNVLLDIRRHIQKSPKHQGYYVYQCQKCDYGCNCEKTFKDHLRQIHFGKEVTDKMINSYIDDMFANDSNNNG